MTNLTIPVIVGTTRAARRSEAVATQMADVLKHAESPLSWSTLPTTS